MNIKSKWLRGLAFATLVGGSTTSIAEDIDLFVGSNPALDASVPNVLFILDNTANWSSGSLFQDERAQLANVFNNLPTNPDGSAKFNIGLMFYTETGQGDMSNPKGAYVRAAIRPMTTANKALYASMITNLHEINDKANTGLAGLAYAEAYRYFVSGAAYSGHNHVKTDYTNNTLASSNLSAASANAMRAIYALPGNALSAKPGPNYISPLGAGCGKTYIIFLSNGPAQDAQSNNNEANTLLSQAGGSTTQIPISPSGSQPIVADEWSRFLYASALGVTSFTIEVNPSTTGQAPGWTAMMKSIASVSQGKYYPVNATVDAGAGIGAAINAALSEIQAVNTVFASVSLPVSVNTQGTFLNQVYIGMFRPDGQAAPRWAGNLKQYKLGLVNNTIKLVDADDVSAVNAGNGFIAECARSFWTPSKLTGVDSYWQFKPQGACIPPSGQSSLYYANSNTPDGSIVEKGGQGFRTRSATTRAVKTCSKTFASCTSLTNFNNGNADIDQASLGTADATARTNLINWAIGTDVDNENQNGSTTEMRPSVHGDVVHSRPVALNFVSGGTSNVVVFYGGNDGVFRAINGNRTTAMGTVPAGGELFAFLPPEMFPILKRLKDNAPAILFPNTQNPTTQTRRNYGIDGTVIAHQTSNTSAWIYSTMRRGGRVVYAFNVNAADPANPVFSLKWKQGCPNTFTTAGTVDDTGCSNGFDGIGQTWSAPQVLKAPGYGAGATPLLIMGGGYNPICEDPDPPTASCTAQKGNKVYVMDADGGTLLKTFTTDRPVAADVTVAPNLNTGLANYAYVADTGGNLYRITIGNDAPANWTMTKIASLGCATTAACTRNRKFLFPPDVIEEDGGYSILIGSGDREKPLTYTSPSTNDVVNYFFKVHDEPATATWLTDEAATCGSGVMCLDSLLGITTSANPTADQLAAKKGWYLGLTATEQVVTSSITIFGTTTFSTHQPSTPAPGSCTNDLGISRVYNVAAEDAASQNGTNSRSEVLPPVGLPPSPVAGKVTLDNGVTMPFCIGCDATSPLEAGEPPFPVASTPTIPKARVYWYTEQ